MSHFKELLSQTYGEEMPLNASLLSNAKLEKFKPGKMIQVKIDNSNDITAILKSCFEHVPKGKSAMIMVEYLPSKLGKLAIYVYCLQISR